MQLKSAFIAAGLATVAIGQTQVALRWRTPLDFRGEASTTRSYVAGLHLLPSGQITAVSQREDYGSIDSAVFYTNLTKLGQTAQSKTLTQSNLTYHRIADSVIDTSGRLYLATNTLSAGRFARYATDGTELYQLNNIKPILGVVAEPFGNTYNVSGSNFSGVSNFVEKRGLAGESKWVSAFPNPLDDIVVAEIRLDSAGNILVVAEVTYFSNPNSYLAVWKLTPSGATIYCRMLPIDPNQYPTRVSVDSQNNLVVMTGSGFFSHSNLISIRGTDGAILWGRSLPATGSDMVVDGSDRVLVAYPTGQAALRAYSRGGTVLWTKAPFDDPARDEFPGRIAVDAYGEIYLGGRVPETGEQFLVKTAANGTARFATRWSDSEGKLGTPRVAVHNLTGDIVMSSAIIPASDTERYYGVIFGLQQAPLVKNDSYVVPKDQTSSPGSFTANDQFAQASGIVIVTQPLHGTITWEANGQFSYTPDAGFTGTDSFTYRLRKADLSSFAAKVTLTVQ